MITAIEYLFLALLTLGTGLISAYIVYRVVKPRAERLISDYTNMVPARIKKELGSALKDATENIDIGAIAGQLGGGEGEGNPLGALGGLLGNLPPEVQALANLMGGFGGQKTKGKGHSPGR